MYTVVIPTHNRPELLARALRSVYAQTVLPSQVIVVDDASEPRFALSQEFCDGRTRLIRHASPVGGAAARNTGLREAPTSIVAFLDDDDEWLPTKMEKQLAWLDAHPEAVLVTCGYIRCETGRQYLEIPTQAFVERYREHDNFFGSFSYLVVRRSPGMQLDAALPALQDWDFALRVTRGSSFGVIEEPLVRYHAHDLPRITTGRGNHLRGLRRCYLKHRFHLSQDARRWVLARVIFERARLIPTARKRAARVAFAIYLSAGCRVPFMMKARAIGRRAASLGFSQRTIVALRSRLLAAGQALRARLHPVRVPSIPA